MRETQEFFLRTVSPEIICKGTFAGLIIMWQKKILQRTIGIQNGNWENHRNYCSEI